MVLEGEVILRFKDLELNTVMMQAGDPKGKLDE